MKERGKLVKWFSESNKEDINQVGGKGANLSEMYNNKFPIPPGFVVTAEAYRYFIETAGIKERIQETLNELDVNDTEELNRASKEIRELIESSGFPKDLVEAIEESYDILDVEKKSYNDVGNSALEILKTGHEPPFVAVRSSATAEDLEGASFAGQQESFLNVKGEKEVLRKVRKCFSSLFTPRAIYYREKKGFGEKDVALAVVIQKMIDSEKSGVVFSMNPVKNDNTVLIESVWGLGEGIVSGKIKPDNYKVERSEEFIIKSESISEKKIAIVRDSSGNNKTVKLSEEKSKQRVLSNYEIKRLAQYTLKLEEHYGKAQDVEFAISENQIYIVQSRPITTEFKENQGEISGTILLSGLGASPGTKAGVVKVVKNLEELSKVKNGDVLVTEMTNPDMVVSMQKAAAIITDEGGLTSHASIVSREMGIPAVVGTGQATEKLHDGQVVTVDGSSGKVYEGRGEESKAEIEPVVEGTKTKIKTIVDIPEYAERAAKCKARGVGLVRLEGIIASSGKHPSKYVKENRIEDYIQLIFNGLKKIAENFDEIWVRSSDIRSDEYRNLEGSSKEVEGNPMLGDHGIRFSLRHPEILRAELQAVKEVADEFPNKKIGFMAPQVIGLNEIKEMKRIARDEVSVPENVRIGIMVETPAAVQQINEFCEEGIDFISFGTNDLTQYTLAIDRNNSDVQYLYDEMNPAVLNSIRYVIRRCKHYGVETSICGQAGSKEEMVKFLVEQGIDSISVNADAARKVSELVAKLEGMPLENKVIEDRQEVGNEPLNVNNQEKLEENPVRNIGNEKGVEEDMESMVLKELDGFDSVEDKPDVPELNEAIPVTSGELVEEKEEKEYEIKTDEQEVKNEVQEKNDEQKLLDNTEETTNKAEEIVEEIHDESIGSEVLEDLDEKNEWSGEDLEDTDLKRKEKDTVLDIF